MPQKPILTDSIVAGGAIIKKRFVDFDNLQASAAGQLVAGIADYEASAAGKQVPIHMLGTAEVEAGGAFARGAELMTDAQGRAVTRAGANALSVARALQASGGAGQVVEVLLLPARSPAPAA